MKVTKEQFVGATYVELIAENSKLLKERDKYYDLYVQAIADAEVWHLQWSAEHQKNAKFRELVKALDWCTENTDLRSRCDECPLNQSNTLEPECEVIMRELGMKGSNA